MKTIFVILVYVLLFAAAPVLAQDTPQQWDPAKLELRIEKLEGMKDQQAQSITLAKQELDQRFSALQAGLDDRWMTLMLSLFGLAGGVITALGLYFFSLKKMRERIAADLTQKVSLDLEVKLGKELGDKLDVLVDRKVHTLESAADTAGEGLRIRAAKHILILSPNQASGEAVKAVLAKDGFQHVEIFLIQVPGKMPSADLYIFDLHKDKPASGWGALEDEHLIDMYNHDKTGAGFLFYTEIKLHLTGIKDKARHNFSNSEATLPTRVAELLKNHPFKLQ